MSQELHYTSVPRGLKPGTRGFCTVACTPQMPGPLAERLENLSGYQPVYAAHDPSAALNPVNYSHVRLNVGGRMLSVLSRVGPAALDYTGRANKYAHHIVLDSDERPIGGPAWLLSQPGFLQAAWEGEPRVLAAGRKPPQGDRPAGVATNWQAMAGDAGWAGVLAESFLADPRRPVILIFRPGMDLLPLFVEAIALFPPPRRWEVEFGTYLSQVPQGMTYAWRGVLDGSPEASSALRLPNALIVNLCNSLGPAQGGVLVHLARTGERREQMERRAVAPPPEPFSRAVQPGGRPLPAAGPPPPVAATRSPAGYELMPDLAARLAPLARYSEGHGIPRRELRRTAVWAAGVVVALFLIVGVTALFLDADGVARKLGLKSELIAETARKTQELEQRSAIVSEREATAKPTTPDDKSRTHQAAQLDATKVGDDAEGRRAVSRDDPKPPTPPVAKSDTPSTLPPKPRRPMLMFLSLPRVPGKQSGIKGTELENTDAKDFPLVKECTQFLETHYLSQLFEASLQGDCLEIRRRKLGALDDDTPVATLKIVDKKTLRFQWSMKVAQSSQKSEFENAFHDLILTVRADDGGEVLILLRDIQRPTAAFDLTRTERTNSNDVKLKWPEHAIAGTKWTWGIRSWKIVNRLQNGGPTTIAEGGSDGGDVKKEIQSNIDQVDVKVSIKINKNDEDAARESWFIQVGLLRDAHRIQEYKVRREEILNAYKIHLESTPSAIAKRLDDLKSSMETSEKPDGKKIPKADIREIEDIIRKDSIYEFINKCESSKLSLVISVKLNDKKTIDILRCGEFAEAQPSPR